MVKMKERQPRRTDWLTRGALIGALAIGSGAFVQHETGQEQQIKSLTSENQRLWEKVKNPQLPENLQGELFLLWVSSCVNQARFDQAVEGQTDITPDMAGMAKCKDWAEIWRANHFSGR